MSAHWIDLQPWTPPDLCSAKRGKRGRVRCEIQRNIPHDEHIGRGRRGQWFVWRAGRENQ